MNKINAHESRTRPDEDIARDVLRHLKADIEVPDDRIRIKVADGVVVVSGIVARAEQRRATEACVRKIKGIREVENQIALESNPSLAGA